MHTVYLPDFGNSKVFWFYYFAMTLVYANSVINPFIYSVKYREFQQGVRRLMSRLTGNPTQIQSHEDSNKSDPRSDPARPKTTTQNRETGQTTD